MGGKSNNEKIIKTRIMKTGNNILEVTLVDNKLTGSIYCGGYRWICIENPCDINGNSVIQFPEDDCDLLNLLMYNEIINGKLPIEVFKSYFYFLINGDNEWIDEEKWDDIKKNDTLSITFNH